VGAATFGWMFLGVLRFGGARSAATAFTDRHLINVLVYESILTALLVPWLLRRGWSPRQVAGKLTAADVLRGAGLWIAAWLAVSVVWTVISVILPASAQAFAGGRQFTGVPATATVVILVSVFNPIFEEFLWLGYAVSRLAPRIGWPLASALSLVLRTAVHGYQGPWALIGVFVIGLTFTAYYARTRRLWPIIFAHVLFDGIGLATRLANH
jgi:uncharacterized protein